MLHGECVGIGMIYMVSEDLKDELKSILNKYHLPTSCNITKDELYKYISLDKKRSDNYITIIKVSKIGTYEIEKIELENIKSYL